MAPGPRITIAIAEKRFLDRPTPLYSGLSIAVAPGSVVALLGRSGVGKSTLLRMIAGIDRRFVGTIAIDGMPPAGAAPPGFAFQDPRLLPWLTALDNIVAVMPDRDVEMARRWLDRVGLGGSERALPRQLSGGMQRRVALARALAVNPKLLLLDEPFVSLDRKSLVELYALCGDLIAEEQSTAILVSHVPEDAARLAHRAIVIGGRPARILADRPVPMTPSHRTLRDIEELTIALTAGNNEESV
jgi:NitT/TauT family transport system ATP-binding protein/sulfonate transport system ATP-binding protein